MTNWTLVESNIMRLCPVCAQGVREEFEMPDEATTRATPRTQCGFKFPTLGTTASNFGVFRD